MHRNTLIPSLLVSVLASFVAWSVIWTLQDRSARAHGIGDNPVMMGVRSSGVDEDSASDNVAGQFADILSRYGVAVIIDGNGDGHPILEVLDPSGIVPWLSQYRGMLVPEDRPKAILFEGSYSEDRWEDGSSLTLLPNGSRVVGTVDSSCGNGILQAVCVPAAADHLDPGTYAFSSMPEGLIEELRPFLRSSGLEIASLRASPVWLELISSPMFVIASLLLAFGLLTVGVYWRTSLGNRSDDFRLVHMVGGSAHAMVRREFAGCVAHVLVGILLGAVASGMLTQLVSQSPPPEGSVGWLCLTTGLSAAALLFLNWLALRSSIANALGDRT